MGRGARHAAPRGKNRTGAVWSRGREWRKRSPLGIAETTKKYGYVTPGAVGPLALSVRAGNRQTGFMHAVALALNASSPAVIITFGLVLLCGTTLLRRRSAADDAGEERKAGVTLSLRDRKLVPIDRGRAPNVEFPRQIRRAGNG